MPCLYPVGRWLEVAPESYSRGGPRAGVGVAFEERVLVR